MKLYKDEIEVAEREDMTYNIFERTNGTFQAEVSFRPEGRRWETYVVGNERGYKTERGAMNAIKKDAARSRKAYPNGYTLVMV